MTKEKLNAWRNKQSFGTQDENAQNYPIVDLITHDKVSQLVIWPDINSQLTLSLA